MDLDLSFETKFAQTYPQFTKKLVTVSDNLTAKEIKVCMLLKMNYNSNQIVMSLGISKSNFLNTRSSIRKKLNLDRKDNLIIFLLSL
ncbi:MAG: Uncharacterised protein [Flavobacteriaceae bacterium]|nr:MAG: Uncharacterised protein [Flavobacteriaceae bacterium]|tara:strand:- start:408 stop:668 length:261 start_codon:yes stop_codon:yes gene_type:complete